MRFTDISIKALKPKDKQYELFEKGSMGFHIRVTPRGVKTFAYRYSFHGKAKRMTIGHYPAMSLKDAKTASSEAHNQVLSGQDPMAAQKAQNEKNRKAPTLQELIDVYIKNYSSKRNKTWEQREYYFNHYLPDEMRQRKAKDIQRWEIFTLLEEINNKGRGATSNMLRVFLKVLFDYAVERSVIEASPLWGIKKMHKPKGRERFLNEDEIKYYWNELPKVINCSKVIELTLKTMLATGQRSGEVRNMKTSDLDFENLIWIIPETKNGKEHRVPLSPLAVDLIREAYQLHKKYEFIFNSPIYPYSEMDRQALARVIANFCNKGNIEKFTPHDLRRTFTTHCISNGLRRDWVKYALNHSEGDVTAIYDRHQYDAEKRTVLDTWANILLDIVNSEDKAVEEKKNVINFLLARKGE